MVFIESTTEMEEMRQLRKQFVNRPNQRTTMTDLAYILFHMGDYDRTISFCQKILRENTANQDDVIRCYSILGQAYPAQPRLALQSFENALKLQLQYNPTDFNNLAAMYNNMGYAHRRLASDNHIIVDYYEKALKMSKAVSNKRQTNWCLVATILNNLASVEKHNLNLALERERLVLDIRLKYLPLSHPNVAVTYSNLGEVYVRRCEFKEALKCFDEALRLSVKYLPNGHPTTVDLYFRIALIHFYKGEYETKKDQKNISEESYKRSLELYDQAFDVSLGELIASFRYEAISSHYNNCGVVCIRLGQLDKALEFLNKAKNIDDEHLSDDHDHHGLSFLNRGKIFTLQNDMNKGLEYYNLAVEFYNRVGLSDSFSVAQTYFNIGEWYQLSEQKDLAIEYYERAARIVTISTETDLRRNLLLQRCEKVLGSENFDAINSTVSRKTSSVLMDRFISMTNTGIRNITRLFSNPPPPAY
jgi:tetratricopeptide (TPR) repeat protein